MRSLKKPWLLAGFIALLCSSVSGESVCRYDMQITQLLDASLAWNRSNHVPIDLDNRSIKGYSWSYQGSKGSIFLVAPKNAYATPACLIFLKKFDRLRLVANSKPHYYCKFSDRMPQIFREGGSTMVRFHNFVDATGDLVEFSPDYISLRFNDKTKNFIWFQ